MSDASLLVRGTEHFGWTDVSVTRSMEQLASSFDISFVERWSETDKPIPIVTGDACTIKLDKAPAVKGFVTDADINYDANSHAMHVAGKSNTIDLVECSAVYATGKGQWRGRKLKDIAIDLCQPFGITVSVKADLGDAFRRFSVQDGETVYEALERACRMRGVLMMTGPEGELVLTRVSTTTTKTKVEYGVNIVRGGRQAGWSERFSQYILKTQVAGDDDLNGSAAASIKRTSKDDEINRYRPLIIQSESQETGKELQKRADWERNVRAGRGSRLTYDLVGWQNAEGLWEPNVLVRVIDPRLKVDAQLLVISVQQKKSISDGSMTTLQLADPKTMSVEPLKPKPDKTVEFP